MLVMPLFHVHGLLCGLLAPLATGGSMVVPPKFSASDFWQDFIAHRANWYTAVPTMHQAILARAERNPESVARARLRSRRSGAGSTFPIRSPCWTG
jgi:oxalate---CoA ligase